MENGTVHMGSQSRPSTLSLGGPRSQGVADTLSAFNFHIGAQPARVAWRHARLLGRAPMTTWSMATPSTRLRLHAATPTPRWQLQERVSHQSSGQFGGARHRSGQVASRWMKASGLGLLASRA
jgi:hypothetical protein